MDKKKYAALGIAALTIATLTTTTVGTASADELPEQANEHAQEQHHDAPHGFMGKLRGILDAVKNGDFQSFSEILAEHPRLESINNEESFNIFTQSYELREQGDYEGARELMESILPRPEHQEGEHQEKPKTFDELLERHPELSERVGEENVDKLRQAFELAQSGNKEGAKAIFDEIGFHPPRPGHRIQNMRKHLGQNGEQNQTDEGQRQFRSFQGNNGQHRGQIKNFFQQRQGNSPGGQQQAL